MQGKEIEMDSGHKHVEHSDHDHTHDHTHDHAHTHDHHHGPGHHHHHIPKRITQAFVIGIVLNSVFVVVEVVAGLLTHSLALLTDAGHNLSDVASLALAWLATRFALKKSNPEYTFGYKQSTVLVALLNAGILLLALGAIAYEALMRLHVSQPVEGKSIAVVATVGIVINVLTALLFMRDKDSDLNLKGAYLHMASDALVSLGVVIGGLVMLYTGWYWLDSVLSLIIVIIVVYGTWDLLRESLRLSLNGVPRNVNMAELTQFLSTRNGIREIHDLHVWAMSTTENALTVHLVMPDGFPDDSFYQKLRSELLDHYHINHSTIQIERGEKDALCAQKC
ncbi:MAG TPA: cation diffusion facilitator family transporter [Bacteroidia bacterium]|nr:cation diffusion facilitator family transporter [Bacteroidia bacterium]